MTEPIKIRRNPAAHDHSKDEEGSVLRPKVLYIPDETYGSVDVGNIEPSALQQILQQIQKEIGTFSSRSNLKTLHDILGWADVAGVRTLEQRLGYQKSGSIETDLAKINDLLTKLKVGGSYLLADHFTQPDGDPIGWSIENGSPKVINQYLLCSGSYVLCTKGSTSWRNYTLLVRQSQQGNYYHRIVFRFQDINNYYYLQWQVWGGRYRLFKVVNGVESQIGSSISYSFATGVYYWFEIDLSGSNIDVRIYDENGNLLSSASFVDDSIKNGKIGVGTGSSGSNRTKDVLVIDRDDTLPRPRIFKGKISSLSTTPIAILDLDNPNKIFYLDDLYIYTVSDLSVNNLIVRIKTNIHTQNDVEISSTVYNDPSGCAGRPNNIPMTARRILVTLESSGGSISNIYYEGVFREVYGYCI